LGIKTVGKLAFPAILLALAACSNSQVRGFTNTSVGHSRTLYNEAVRLDKMGDHDAAIRDFRESANLGNVKAMLRMGAAYAIGHDVLINKTRAAYWIKKAYNKAKKDGDDDSRKQASYIWDRFELWKY